MSRSPSSSSSSMTASTGQLTLGVSLQDDATFENFHAAADQQALQALQAFSRSTLDEPYIYLWGSPGSGRSHLLQAACHELQQQGAQAFYLPLTEVVDYGPQVLEGLDDFDLVCLDDVQAIAARADWELALFHLFNRLRDSGRRLLVTADQAPAQLPLQLADLASRLSWGLIYQLQGLSDEEKLAALKLRAKRRGFALTDEVAQYILHRSPRDMRELFVVLERLDRASLSAQRKVTIPFVKTEMNW